jgi:hypothetical protein
MKKITITNGIKTTGMNQGIYLNPSMDGVARYLYLVRISARISTKEFLPLNMIIIQKNLDPVIS